jgi:hypothetical protein
MPLICSIQTPPPPLMQPQSTHRTRMSTVLLTNPDSSLEQQHLYQSYGSLVEQQLYHSLDRRHQQSNSLPSAAAAPSQTSGRHRASGGGGSSFDGSFTAVSAHAAGGTFHVSASNPFRTEILNLGHVSKEQLRSDHSCYQSIR